MWNDFRTDAYAGLIAETVSVKGHDGKQIHAYWSRPLGCGPHPGIILIPHMPGWDEWCRETCHRFTAHGYSVLCPDIYQDFGFGTPTEVSGRMREAGGVFDASVMGDTAGCLDFLRSQPGSNGKTGTTEMLNRTAKAAGMRTVCNSEGSNQIEGVTAALLGACDLGGKIAADAMPSGPRARWRALTRRWTAGAAAWWPPRSS